MPLNDVTIRIVGRAITGGGGAAAADGMVDVDVEDRVLLINAGGAAAVEEEANIAAAGAAAAAGLGGEAGEAPWHFLCSDEACSEPAVLR